MTVDKGIRPERRTRVAKLALPGRVAAYWVPGPASFSDDERCSLAALGFDEAAISAMSEACGTFAAERKCSEGMPSQAQSRAVLSAVNDMAGELATVIESAAQFTLVHLIGEALVMRCTPLNLRDLVSTLRNLQVLAWRAADRLPSTEPTREPVGISEVFRVPPAKLHELI